ncbi:MAG TPA: hypothetical protein VI300_01205, partial [Solirubrobacter sp.]
WAGRVARVAVCTNSVPVYAEHRGRPPRAVHRPVGQFAAADRRGSFEGQPRQVDPDVWENPGRLGDDAREPPDLSPGHGQEVALRNDEGRVV